MYAAVQETSALAGVNTADAITRRAAIRAVDGLATTTASETHGQSGQTLARITHGSPRSLTP
jgi:hypothetical protein